MPMDFYSSRARFARVAACTLPVAAANPARNADEIIEQARACSEEGWRWPLPGAEPHRVLDRRPLPPGPPPRRDRGSDRTDRRGVGRSAARHRRGSSSSKGHGSSTVRWSSTAEPSSGFPQGLPADLPRVLRGSVLRVRNDQRGEDDRGRRVAGAVRHRPALGDRSRGLRPRGRGVRGHVDPRAAERGAALAGRPSSSTSPARPSRSVGPRTGTCSAAAPPPGVSPPTSTRPRARESTTDLSWDGQTMIYERGRLLAETERFPEGPRRSVADIDLDMLRQERMRMGTFDDNRRTVAERIAGSGPSSSSSVRQRGTSGSGARSTVSRSCPMTRTASPSTATRRTTSRCPGSEQRLRASASRRSSSACRGARLDACPHRRGQGDGSAPAAAHDILAFTMPGFATSAHTKNNAILLMEALGVTWEELDIRPPRRRCCGRWDTLRAWRGAT